MGDQENNEILNETLSEMRRDIELQSAKLEDKFDAMERVHNDFIASMESSMGIRDEQVNAKVQESIDTSNKVYDTLRPMTQALMNGRDKAEVGEMLYDINAPVKVEPMTPILKTPESTRKIDFESSPIFETPVSSAKQGRELTPDSIYSKSRFNTSLIISLVALIRKDTLKAILPGKGQDPAKAMIALNIQLAKIHQELENVRLLPLILGYVPTPAMGEILPAKDVFHPRVFGFGSRGFGPKRIMCGAYDISLFNHDYNVSKEVIYALIEKN